MFTREGKIKGVGFASNNGSLLSLYIVGPLIALFIYIVVIAIFWWSVIIVHVYL